MPDRLIRNKKGFTLIEVIIGVAVIAILLAVGIPSIITVKANLRITELDAAAKEIYTASQNRLTAMKASGELDEFCDELYSGHGDRSVEDVFVSAPPGYPEDSDDWRYLFYLSSDEDIFKAYMMSQTAFQAIEGEYIIEFNPDSGNVFSVFYGKYDSPSDFVSIYKDYAYYNRARDDRKDVAVGYYSGSDASVSVMPDALCPNVTVHNNEELYLEITCGDILQFAATRQYLTLTLTLTDQHGGAWEQSYNGLSDMDIAGENVRLYALLDSMRDGYSFSEITGLAAGDDITAVAEMEYSYRGKDITTDPEYLENTATFNSLFGSIADTGDGKTVAVSKLRHLNNLRSDIFEYIDSDINKVTQTTAIDFDSSSWSGDEWCPDTQNKVNPLEYFIPIENDNLFGSSGHKGNASFSGGKIENMIIGNGGDETGLFAHVNCDVSGVRLTDPVIRGGSYTGALAGRVYGENVSDCGVYLTTADKYGTDYSSAVMDQRVDTYIIDASDGAENVGGLIGCAEGNTSVSGCFAALNVAGNITDVGGFIGRFGGTEVTDSYCSGDVEADSHAGGFAGVLTSGTIDNCYATSYVTADSYAGGFAGTASGGNISGCMAYGVTKKFDATIDTSTSGGFIGYGSAGCSNCAYLRQNSYNNGYSGRTDIGVEAKSYASLTVDPANSPSNSFPYDEGLRGMAFPFKMVCSSHYGNWPQEETVDTSLVYYEKYINAQGGIFYGYYADGYANTGEGDSVFSWNLDTLLTQDEMDAEGYWIEEDGYAVLSIYNLVQIKYELNSASEKTLTVSASAGNADFVLLENPASLSFSTVQDGEKIGTFSVKYLYIFQLPFELQETDRDASFAFYDMLKMTGYAKGNLDTSVFSEYTFYYCPHFAKNAINPDVSETTAGRPKYPDEFTVFVRSPRQLNALGRYCYYWSRANNNSQEYNIIFTQGIDLDYSKYTTFYCGRSFNLMSTDKNNEYRNRPIGRPVNQTFIDPWGTAYTPGSFKNSYYGNGYKIIDYRQYCYYSDNYQFAGLFGEINSATIKDVIMVASDPNACAGTIESINGTITYGSGYIVNEYDYSRNDRSPGTGTLVGLSYADNAQTLATVENCCVSGYAVIYYESGSLVSGTAAVGGLMGFNLGVVENCSADCALVTAVVGANNNHGISVSGLVGGIINGSINSCYAGGKLTLNIANRTGTSSTINGITGYCYVWNTFTGSFSVNNCYSFCNISQENGSDYSVYGSAGNGINKPYNIGESISGCYYLSNAVDKNVTLTERGGVSPMTYKQLSETYLPGFGEASNEHTYPWSAELDGCAYPFPATVTNPGGDYIHYGDWTVYYPQTAYVTYYEIYDDGETGLYYYDENDELYTSITENGKEISRAGYGLLKLTDGNGAVSVQSEDGGMLDASTEAAVYNYADQRNGEYYDLYPFTDTATVSLLPENGRSERKITLACDMSFGEDQTMSLYINDGFARAISLEQQSIGLDNQNPWDIRTPQQLCAISGYTAAGNSYFAQTHDVDVSAYTPQTESYGGTFDVNYTYDGSGFIVSGAVMSVFEQNAGTVNSLTLTNSSAEMIAVNSGQMTGCEAQNTNMEAFGSSSALITGDNSGQMTGCTVSGGTLTLNGNAAGAALCASNSGNITGCTVTGCTVNSTTSAALFVYDNTGGITDGTVQGCNITGSGTVAGFIYNHSAGDISNSMVSDGTVSGYQAAGFVQNSASNMTGCAVVRVSVSADGIASGFALANSGTLNECYVGPAPADSSYIGCSYNNETVNGASAYGFTVTSSGNMQYCYSVAAVSASSGTAAGFGESLSGNTSYCFANCTVFSPSSASGFATTCSNVSNSYSCGSVSGATSYGFMAQGSASYCYSISSVQAGGFGFAGAAYASNCYWVQDADNGFNTGVTSQSGDDVTFYELRNLSWIDWGEAYPFDTANGTWYPYSIQGIVHRGNWPYNPGVGAGSGYIGVARATRYNAWYYLYSYFGYDCADEVTYQDSENGPKVTFSGNGSGGSATKYYLYVSDDLYPGLNDTGGWTYSTNNAFVNSYYALQVDNYHAYEITFNPQWYYSWEFRGWYYGSSISFSLNDTLKFTVRYDGSSITLS